MLRKITRNQSFVSEAVRSEAVCEDSEAVCEVSEAVCEASEAECEASEAVSPITGNLKSLD